MKKLFILIPAIIISISGFSQNADYSFIKKDLKLLSMNEAMNMPLNPDDVKEVYLEDGTKTTFEDVIKNDPNMEMFPQIFVDNEGTPQVIVFKKMTEAEMTEIEGMAPEEVDLTGQTANSFEVEDIKGNKFSLDNLKGKIVVVNFWFIACKPCVEEMPELNEIVAEYKDNKNIVFLGFAMDKKESLEKFLEKNKFDYQVIADSEYIARDYQVSSFPTSMIIDKDSKIVYQVTGGGPGIVDELKSNIKKFL